MVWFYKSLTAVPIDQNVTDTYIIIINPTACVRGVIDLNEVLIPPSKKG